MNEAYPPLPPDIGRALDRLEGGAVTWDLKLACYLRDRCLESFDGHAQFSHRRHQYRCESHPARIEELLHPKTDVLGPGPLPPRGGTDRVAPLVRAEVGMVPDPLGGSRSFREVCRDYLRDWRVGTFRSLTVEVRALARLFLEQDGHLPTGHGLRQSWAASWLDLAHDTAFQVGVPGWRERNERTRRKRRSIAALTQLEADNREAEGKPPVATLDPGQLWHAGPALELALLSSLWVLVNPGFIDWGSLRGPPREWVRPLVAHAWQLLPPCWLRSRETRFEFRLGTERIPAGIRCLFGPALLKGAFEFDRHLVFPAESGSEAVSCKPAWLFGVSPGACPFGVSALERFAILLEEVLTSCTLLPVPGAPGWSDWQADFPVALTQPLPFHLRPPRFER